MNTEAKKINIVMNYYDKVAPIFYKNSDNRPIYLDIEIDITHNDNKTEKLLYLSTDESQHAALAYMHTNAIKGLLIKVLVHKG